MKPVSISLGSASQRKRNSYMQLFHLVQQFLEAGVFAQWRQVGVMGQPGLVSVALLDSTIE